MFYKLLIKIPNYNDLIIDSTNLTPVNNNYIYKVNFSNYSIILEIYYTDDSTNNNTKVTNIFNKSISTYWESQQNFINYNNTSYITSKTLYNDLNEETKCGAYVIFNLEKKLAELQPGSFLISFSLFDIFL